MNTTNGMFNGGGGGGGDVIPGKNLTAREKKMLTSNGDIQDEKSIETQTEVEEWNNVPTDVLVSRQATFDFKSSIHTPINFFEAWAFFQSNDMTPFMKQNHQGRNQSSIEKTMRRAQQSLMRIMTPRRLVKTSMNDRELIFAVANCPLNNDVIVHQRIIQSIYVFLTKKSNCPRYGNHWEQVGFQGQDPASDLRGVGMFGALQLLFLSCCQETKDSLAPDILELSNRESNQFPLAVLSLNVTKMALDAFRDGLLNKFSNAKNDCISIVNRFYLAILYRIYRKWKEHNLTIHDSCQLLKDVEKWCRAHPAKAMRRLEEYIAQNTICNGNCVCSINGDCKQKRHKKKTVAADGSVQHMSWLDLTKPSLEVFI